MGKFLNETGLSYFWTKTKEYLKKKYVGIGDTINYTAKDGNTVTIGNASAGDGIIEWYNGNTEKPVTTLVGYDGIVIGDESGDALQRVAINTNYIELGKDGAEFVNLTNDSINLGSYNSSVKDKVQLDKLGITFSNTDNSMSLYGRDLMCITENGKGTVISSQVIRISSDASNLDNSEIAITLTAITAPKFVKTNGTANQVLLANGNVAELNAANGIPKLDANGRIPLSQLGNLDTTLFEVVSALPTTSIKKNHIYLVASTTAGANNSYIEYIYTGDVSATYDATKWEKIGEYKADVDLTPYAKKTEAIAEIQNASPSSFNGVDLWYKLASDTDEVSHSINIANATTSKNGIMSAKDKTYLNVLLAKFPLKIESFTLSTTLLGVNDTMDVTAYWRLSNTDIHPVNRQTINWAGTTETISDNTEISAVHRITALQKSGTKTITLTVRGDGISDGSGVVPLATASEEVTITYHYPSYIGVVAKDATINETALKALTESIEWGKGKKAALTQSSQKIVYAYPAEYGDLTSIKDGNGFEGFAGYTKTTLDFTINGNKVTYNVYTQKEIATSDSTYTFA